MVVDLVVVDLEAADLVVVDLVVEGVLVGHTYSIGQNQNFLRNTWEILWVPCKHFQDILFASWVCY